MANKTITSALDLHNYVKELSTRIAGISQFYYLDSGETNLAERINHFYANINQGNATALLFALHDSKLIAAGGTHFHNTFLGQIFVVKKCDTKASVNALIEARHETHKLIMKVIGTIVADMQDWEPTTNALGRFSCQINNDVIIPETRLAGSNAYGYSIDIDFTIQANSLMYN